MFVDHKSHLAPAGLGVKRTNSRRRPTQPSTSGKGNEYQPHRPNYLNPVVCEDFAVMSGERAVLLQHVWGLCCGVAVGEGAGAGGHTAH